MVKCWLCCHGSMRCRRPWLPHTELLLVTRAAFCRCCLEFVVEFEGGSKEGPRGTPLSCLRSQ